MRNRKLTRKQIEARLAPIRPKQLSWMAVWMLMQMPTWRQEIILEAVEQVEFAYLAREFSACTATVERLSPEVAALDGARADCWTSGHMALARKYNNTVRRANALATSIKAMCALPHIAELINESQPEQETK
jgi:hypothetical protein